MMTLTNKEWLGVSFVLMVCSFFYIMGITVGVPLAKTETLLFGKGGVDEQTVTDMVEGRNIIYAQYQDHSIATPFTEDELLYLSFLRGFFLRSYVLDSHKIFGMLAMMRANNLNPMISYHNGCAYLYPLGAYLFALQKTGIIEVTSNVATYVRHPEKVARILVAGRFFMVLVTIFSLLCVYYFARMFVSHGYALIAMLFYGLAPLIVVYAHDVKPWLYANLFFTLALIYGRRIADSSRLSNYVWAGVWSGLAMGSIVPSGVVIVYACMNHVMRCSGESVEVRDIARASRDKKILLSVGLCVVVFLATNPYLLLAFKQFMSYQIWNFNVHYKVEGSLIDFLVTQYLPGMIQRTPVLFGLLVFWVPLLIFLFKKCTHEKVFVFFFLIQYAAYSYFAYARIHTQSIVLAAVAIAMVLFLFSQKKTVVARIRSGVMLALVIGQLGMWLAMAIGIGDAFAGHNMRMVQMAERIDRTCMQGASVSFVQKLIREGMPILNVKRIRLSPKMFDPAVNETDYVICLGQGDKVYLDTIDAYRQVAHFDLRPFSLKIPRVRGFVGNLLQLAVLDVYVYERKDRTEA